MTSRWVRRPCLMLSALLVLLVLVACSQAQEPAAPAPSQPAGQPSAPAATPSTPAATTAPAPAAPSAPAPGPTAPTVERATTFADIFSTRQITGGPKIDPVTSANEPAVQRILKYQPTALPLWTRAKYGGQAVFAGTPTFVTQNPLKIAARRNATYGRLLYYDQGRCSWQAREDFSACKGNYAENFAIAIVPGVFEKWQQQDPLSYVFTVRKTVLWPAIAPMLRPDREVTAEDIKWYLEKLQTTESAFRSSFVDMKSVEAVDRYTVKVTLSAPLPDFLRSVTQIGLGLFPKECYDTPKCLDEQLITPGPWLVKEFVPRQKLTYQKNPEFFLKGLPYVDEYTTLSIPDLAAQKAAFVSGQIINVRVVTEQDALGLVKQVPGATIQAQYGAASGSAFKPKLEGPFADVRVRRAMMLALDLRSLWAAAFDGMGMIPTEFGSDIIGLGKVVYIGIQNGGEWYQYNPQRAKQLLTEAGYPDGFKTAVTFSGSSVLSSDVPVIIQDMWKRNLGVQLDIKNVDAATISTTAREKSWDGLISNWTAGTWSDGTSGFLTKLKGEAFNIQNIDDPTFGQLFEQARRELDPAKRAALIWQAEQRELDQVYMFRLNHLWVYDVRQPWDLNNAGHLWEAPGFWMAMIDPDKMKK